MPLRWSVVALPTHAAETYEDSSITSPEERTLHFGRFDHLRVYGRDAVARLEQAGFEVQVNYPLEELSVDDQGRFGTALEPLFVCTRRAG